MQKLTTGLISLL